MSNPPLSMADRDGQIWFDGRLVDWRGDTSISERARFDNFYIENWSLWLDVKIILMTFTSVFSKPGS